MPDNRFTDEPNLIIYLINCYIRCYELYKLKLMNETTKDQSEEQIKRLLFSTSPQEDETLFSYILRLAELNDIADVRWIYRSLRAVKIYAFDYGDNFYRKTDLQRLSELSGVRREKLKKLHFEFPGEPIKKLTGKSRFFGQPDWADFVHTIFPKICPACLAENNYCRKIWELSFITTCPHHNCFLIDSCRNCETRIEWDRPSISLCACGFDFRETVPADVSEKETRISTYFHRQFDLSCCSEKIVFSSPIDELNGYLLLKLLCFICSHIYGRRDFTGYSLLGKCYIKQVHKRLNRAMETLDDWPDGYREFVKDLQAYSPHNYFLSWDWRIEEQACLSKKHLIYELINQLQRTILFDQEFSFIHKELLKCFPKLPRNNSNFENGLCYPKLRFNQTPLENEFSKEELESLIRIKQIMGVKFKP